MANTARRFHEHLCPINLTLQHRSENNPKTVTENAASYWKVLSFSCLGGVDNVKYLNEVDLFDAVDPNVSKHKRTDRSVLCCLRKAEAGKSWPRVTKDKAKLNWLSVDFNNWKDWEDDSDEEVSSFDRFSDMMNNMGGGEDDLPDVDGAEDEESADSDDEKMPDLE
ncbi:prostaglandin E synthase 3-like [Acipenser oxyrinchus oxyrinchus]|uniref:Prostaglandin E synthase 3 n=1 Tax=Acipenser oxyrinchus oxyrinchus TaxID=40147 RepID=A0AAD8CIX9_ACIOX|nr:prostaglandin E synthase 3-like [Acipenser oxyrinchus oxyrinchus]